MSEATTQKVDASAAKGKSYHLGGSGSSVVGGRFSASAVNREASIAAATEAATDAGSTLRLPEGVTPAAYQAMLDAGLVINPAPKGGPMVPTKLEGGLLDNLGRTPKGEVAPAAPVTAPTTDPEGPAGKTLAELQETAAVVDAPPAGSTDFMASMTEFSNEWFTSGGKLSDASRETLRTRHQIDDAGLDFILKAVAAASTVDAAEDLKAMGHKVEDFSSWEKWSVAHEDKATREARWEIMRSPSQAVRAQGVKALKDAYTLATREEPALIRGANASDTRSFNQILTKAMDNPLYSRRGPEGDAFRAAIDEQLIAAKRAGRSG